MSIMSKLLLPLKYFQVRRRFRDIKGADIRTANVTSDLKISEFVRVSNKVRIGEQVSIGRYTYISSNSVIESKVTIGAFCSFGPGLYVAPGEHYVNMATTHPIMFDSQWRKIAGLPEKKEYLKSIGKKDVATTIGNDVWCGLNVTILRGVNIGDGAVVAAGAVVTRDVPPYAIVAGVPAKILKYRFGNEMIDFLEQSRWWEKPVDLEWLYTHSNISE